MRVVLRRFVTPRDGGIEVALWSRQHGRPILTPRIRRCVRLYARVRARSRERLAVADD